MHEPLYTADEMRAAEARYPGYPDTAGELMELFAHINADLGTTILMVTHDDRLAQRCCRRTIAMADGGLTAVDPLRDSSPHAVEPVGDSPIASRPQPATDSGEAGP